MAVEDADVAVTVQLDLGFMVFNRIPDYHGIIKHSMDFSTIRKKLDKGDIPTWSDLSLQMYLVRLVHLVGCYKISVGTDMGIFSQFTLSERILRPPFKNIYCKMLRMSDAYIVVVNTFTILICFTFGIMAKCFHVTNRGLLVIIHAVVNARLSKDSSMGDSLYMRTKKGWFPTGSVYRKAVGLGYKSVAHFLIAKHNNKQLPTDIVNNAEELQ
ncbi:hypothetical protein ZEAMMB73_Zm00001d051943 [Zea mays]|uniref:Uncharacterized protein n=1 Tax=Zea mays TaxID=4577 RepID=K7UJZ6_MAIZE|nr:hypothetical protein ZEAMMB73_Zm00001d051943 [Zea mays]